MGITKKSVNIIKSNQYFNFFCTQLINFILNFLGVSINSTCGLVLQNMYIRKRKKFHLIPCKRRINMMQSSDLRFMRS